MSALAVLKWIVRALFCFQKGLEMKDLFTSRKFWTTVIMLLVVIISVFNPNFDLDVEHAAGLAVVFMSYVVGVSIDPGPGGWKGVLQSRKFWAAVLGFLVLVLDGFGIVLPFALSVEQLVAVAVTIGTYIGAVALEKPKLTASQYKAYIRGEN